MTDRSVAKVVGVSMGNSYYNEKTIHRMFEHWSQYCDNLYCIFPAEISIHNFKAAGLSDIKAEREIRHSTSKINRWIDRSIDCIHNKNNNNCLIKKITWTKELESNQFYIKSFENIQEIYSNNIEFKQSVDSIALQVIKGIRKAKTKYDPINDPNCLIVNQNQINEAISYPLKEFAFFSGARHILGVEKILWIYHQDWKLFQDFFNGNYVNQPNEFENMGIFIHDINQS